MIKDKIPHCCIGVDVIVGFPGETEEHFLETYEFLQQLDVSYLHVFTYSERPNTLAATMDGIVPIKERRRRNKMLRILSQKKRLAFYNSFVGQQRDVLFESIDDNGFMEGFTDNYIKVSCQGDSQLLNSIQRLRLDEVNSDLMMNSTLLTLDSEIA